MHHRAQAGANGEGRIRHGRNGADAEIHVPPGTRIIRDDAVIAEVREAGDRVVVARGGNGGVGNRVFRSSTRQAPRETVPGGPGEATWLTLELRLPIDVAIVGLPNSGKSALLVALTGAAAVVAPYPHSTREPAFGPLLDEDMDIHLVADLPGVGADGTPRPDGFLGQCERARVIVHCVDASLDDPPAAERIALVDRTLDAVAGTAARRIIVATFAVPDGSCPGPTSPSTASPGRGSRRCAPHSSRHSWCRPDERHRRQARLVNTRRPRRRPARRGPRGARAGSGAAAPPGAPPDPGLERRHRLRPRPLGFRERPERMADLQAASAVGQGRLFARYARLFAPARAHGRAGPAHERRLRPAPPAT